MSQEKGTKQSVDKEARFACLKRPHGTKFQQNLRNGGSQHCHEIENLSVKRKLRNYIV